MGLPPGARLGPWLGSPWMGGFPMGGAYFRPYSPALRPVNPYFATFEPAPGRPAGSEPVGTGRPVNPFFSTFEPAPGRPAVGERL